MALQMQELIKYTEGVAPLPEAKQRVWNLMGQGKMVMDQLLQKNALEIQGVLKDYDKMDQPALAKALTAYREIHGVMVDTRKGYTGYIDECKDMCMTVEKQYDPKTNEVYKAAFTREFQLREEAQRNAQKAKDKATEEAAFKAFIQNEYLDMAAGYRASLAKNVQDAYNTCLTQRTPVENVHIAINAAVAAMRAERPRNINKMERLYVSDAEAAKIFDTVPKPNYQNVFNEQIEALKAKFSLYANDLANADVALVQQTSLFQQEQAQQAQQASAEKAANTLMAQATTPVVTSTTMKSITETTEIKIEDYSDEWVVKIMAAFMANFQICMAKVRVKKKSKLDIAQMAAALDAANVKVEGVEYVTLKK
jgi:hypothetical protein